MATLDLPLRYCELNPKPGVQWAEENFHVKQKRGRLKPQETALVMVDVWDIHPYESHLERGAQITQERIAPVVDMCRETGVTVVHAPSPGQAVTFPQWVRYAGEREVSGRGQTPAQEWPPAEFRSRSGAFAKYGKPRSARREKWLREQMPKRTIMDCVQPQPEDFVIANGDQLHRLLTHRKVLHLLYAGFAANMCMLHRDYGICAMHKRGYNIVLLGDCTTAIESADTLPDMAHSRASVSIVEMVFGFSTTSEDFLAAGKKLLAPGPRPKRRS